MVLFSGHPVRHIMKAGLAVGIGHVIMKFMPKSLHILHFTQTSVGILAVACFVFFIILHHRSDGRFMTQTQEEMLLIGALGVFWFAFLIAMRVYNQSDVNVNMDHPKEFLSSNSRTGESAVVGAASRNQEAYGAGAFGEDVPRAQAGVASNSRASGVRRPAYEGRKPYQCTGDYCVVEEYTYYDNRRRW